MNHSESLDKLAPALAKAQAEMGGAVKETTNPFFKKKYADLSSVWKACKEALHDNGLSIIQSPTSDAGGRIGVATMLLHTSGQFITGEYTLGVKKDNDPQADGSSITYARRYALAAFVGVCPVDDDGESAMQRKPAANKSKLADKKTAELPLPPTFPKEQQTAIDGWKVSGKAAVANDAFKSWWEENKPSIIKECSEAGAKIVYQAVIK